MKKYNYEWKTAEEIIQHKNDVLEFSGWGETTSLQEVLNDFRPEVTDEDIKKAHELWLKLKEAFNQEGEIYHYAVYSSRLGSIGEKERREVCRPNWWDFLDGDNYGDYRIVSFIIEFLHNGEKLESGTIVFGS